MNGAIEANALAVGYGSDAVVSGLDLIVRPGEALALVGTNGSGKSTLLKTILGLIPSLGGSLRVAGGAPGERPKHIAYLGQAHRNNNVAPIRAIDVVRMGRFASLGLLGRHSAKDRAMVAEAMECMGITHLAEQPLGSLSGGQQQRVYLAQVIAHGADLIVLDEPTAGLDLAGHERYRAMVDDARSRGATVVTATHDIAEAAACDQVLLLNRRVVAQGAPSDVLTTERLLETFGIALAGIAHGDHHDFVLGGTDGHGHEHHAHDHHTHAQHVHAQHTHAHDSHTHDHH